MNVHFDQPWMLLLGLLALPMVVLGWRSLSGSDRLRRSVVLLLRVTLLLFMAVMLAGPHTRREHDQLTVIGLLDISGSVQRFAQLPPLDEQNPEASRSYVQHLRRWFREATQTKAPDDRFGLVVFDGEAIAVSVPSRDDYLDDTLDLSIVAGTNIADAIRLGLAMLPSDTARRLVLVSDGNETMGDAFEAAREAAGGAALDLAQAGRAGGIPIDVLPIAYQVQGDVQISRIEAPATAQPGQTVTVRIVLEATAPTAGTLTLRREGVAVDLNGVEAGRARRVRVPAGQSVHLASAELGETRVNRFEATFEPDDAASDALVENNMAEAFTVTPGKGQILILDRDADRRANPLAVVLSEADLPVQVQTPESLPADLFVLQNYDLIVLDNVAAYELPLPLHDLISRYVHDLGAGLVMIGGQNSFGAGGWNGTALERILPLELDPPREMRLPQAALVLVLDKSGSMNMNVAGARATQQEVANEAAALAIESLRAESLVGVVTFSSYATEYIPLQRNDRPEEIAAKVRRITAEGGTDLEPALLRAHEMLRGVNVDRKHVICLSDGQSRTTNLDAIATSMSADSIRLTTIAVGDGADHSTLYRLSQIGGGEFYPVYNPKALPRVLVDSVQVINKPLIKEVPFIPVVLPTGNDLTAQMGEAPPLGGLVVTAPRDDPTATIEMTHPDGEPLLAQWQVGLGRVAAFTSDFGGDWSRRWQQWPPAAAFWTQLARTIARPPGNPAAELITEIRDDRLTITMEASDQEEGYLDYLQVLGTVYAPEGQAIDVRLRQVAPGRYEASVPARAAGNYIVAVNPRRGDRQLGTVIGGASRTTGDEFRRYQSNLALLDRIVEVTGGRRLDIDAPRNVDLYDRSGMPPSVSVLPVWRYLLALAIGVLLLDIAARRIAWGAAALRALLARALARVAPATIKGGEAAATLSTLRQASSRLEHRAEAGLSREETRSARPASFQPAPLREESGVDRKAPEPSKVAAALDALLGRSGRGRPASEAGDAAEQGVEESASSAAEGEDGGTTSSLLAAKRRLREGEHG